MALGRVPPNHNIVGKGMFVKRMPIPSIKHLLKGYMLTFSRGSEMYFKSCQQVQVSSKITYCPD